MERERAARDDLLSTSEAIRADARQVEALETEKAGLKPGDPRVSVLSQRVVDLTGRMQRKSLVEQELSEEVRAAGRDADDHGSGHRPN